MMAVKHQKWYRRSMNEWLLDLPVWATVQESNVKTETRQRLGTPYEEIVKVAWERSADLIVMATHGYTGLKHFLLGSTTERVVRVSPCPVLVVRQQERDFVS
jgi:nucleotide-binding universal stress UspA family protein